MILILSFMIKNERKDTNTDGAHLGLNTLEVQEVIKNYKSAEKNRKG